ncbi:MAG: GH3 auxin-responsive promoter family protein [Salinivirgaceae bacterium]|nr:GH3 auxin-responsive promoter family protein [Salinivirgaceae bacterium]
MSLLNTIVSWYGRNRTVEINRFRKHPEKTQRNIFLDLIRKSNTTTWGIEHSYKDIKTYRDFQNNVPLQEYNDIKPWIKRIREGEENVLWPGKVEWFAKSSGTTSDKSKFIPVTKEALKVCHFKGGKDVLSLYSKNNPKTGVLKGKTLTLGGSTKISNFKKKSSYGDLSAILINNAPFWTSFSRVPKPELALIEDFDEKIKRVIEATINENIVSIAGVPSWNLVLLREMLKYTGKTNILEVWPNMELFIHGGVSFIPYKSAYEELIPSLQMQYMETYNASEGFFAIQDDPASNDMLLMLDYGVFYEFIPLAEFDSNNPQTLTIGEVELNTPYALVISTNGGLWRYIIGDVVEFTSLYPHKIIITGRTKQYINAFGEELMVHNALEALEVANSATNATIKEFTVAPIFMNNKSEATHQWLIEFETMPENLTQFAEELDNALKAVNSDYEAKRFNNSIIKIPEIVIAAEGLFFEWMKQRGKLGGQNKVPNLSNNRQYMDDLLRINNEMVEKVQNNQKVKH